MIDLDRLQARLDERGLNPFSAAKAAGLGADYVRDILRGKVKQPGGYKLARLARALECSTDYLLGLSDDVGIAPGEGPDHQPLVSHLPVLHRLAARVYRPPEDENEPVRGLSALVFKLSEFDEYKQWLGVVQDEHALPLIARGHAVHVIDIQDDHRPLAAGDVVVVERYTPDRSLVERTLQRVALAHSRQSIYIRQIPSSAEVDDPLVEISLPLLWDESHLVNVVGKVLYSFRPFDARFRLVDLGPHSGAWPD